MSRLGFAPLKRFRTDYSTSQKQVCPVRTLGISRSLSTYRPRAASTGKTSLSTVTRRANVSRPTFASYCLHPIQSTLDVTSIVYSSSGDSRSDSCCLLRSSVTSRPLIQDRNTSRAPGNAILQQQSAADERRRPRSVATAPRYETPDHPEQEPSFSAVAGRLAALPTMLGLRRGR